MALKSGTPAPRRQRGRTRASTGRRRTGVIALLEDTLRNATGPGLTVPEIVDILVANTNRRPAGLETTVRCQLSRFPAERKLKIKKTRLKGEDLNRYRAV